MKKEKVLILFGYWEKNLGDDLFLEMLKQKYSNYKIMILTQKKYEEFYKRNNVHTVTYDTLFYKIINKILGKFKLPDLFYLFYSRKASKAICLGGSLFMENENHKRQLKNLNQLVLNCKESYVIGSNFGPFKTEKFYKDYYSLFAKMNSISFRDEKSCDLFSNLNNVIYAPDLVLNLEKKIEQSDDSCLKDENQKYCIISLIDLDGRPDLKEHCVAYENKMATVISKLANEGYHVKIMSFCEDEGDLRAAERVIKKMKANKEKVSVIPYTTINEALNLIMHANAIIATRFHAMILAFIYDLPVVPIIYSDKMKTVITDYNFKGDYFSIGEINQISEQKIITGLYKKPSIPMEIFEKSNAHLQHFE